MLKDTIELDLGVWNNAGYLTRPVEDPAVGRPLTPENKNRLLHLVFFLVYTKDGRNLIKSEEPGPGKPPATVKANLKAKILAEFPQTAATTPPSSAGGNTISDAVIDMIIDAHLAAWFYVQAKTAGDAAEMAEQEAVYAAKTRFVADALYEDGMGYVFSMDW